MIIVGIRFVCVLVLCAVLVVAQNPAIPTLPWYNVEPWEVEVCHKWGGRLQPVQGVVEQGTTTFGDMTMTVQGKRVKTFAGEFLYEVAYYLESFAAVTRYQIEMINPKQQTAKLIASGELGPQSGAADFVTDYLNETFTHVRLTHDRGVIVSPIIEVR